MFSISYLTVGSLLISFTTFDPTADMSGMFTGVKSRFHPLTHAVTEPREQPVSSGGLLLTDNMGRLCGMCD